MTQGLGLRAILSDHDYFGLPSIPCLGLFSEIVGCRCQPTDCFIRGIGELLWEDSMPFLCQQEVTPSCTFHNFMCLLQFRSLDLWIEFKHGMTHIRFWLS